MKTIIQLLFLSITFLAGGISPALLLAQGYSAVQVSERVSFIGGQITEPTDESIQLQLVENRITQKLKIYNIPLNYKGEFRFEFPLKKNSIVTINYGGEELEVYMEPGDAVKIVSESENVWETVSFDGKAAAHNKYLKAADIAFAEYTDEAIGSKMVKLSSLEFKNYINQLYAEKQDFLERFIKQHKPDFSEDFSKYVHSAIDYWRAYQLMRYRTEYPASNGLEVPMALPTKYYDFLRQIELSNDVALINRNYLYFLDIFLDFAKENPREWQEISKGSDRIIVKNSSAIILEDASGLPIAMPIDKGKLLHIADDRLFADKPIEATSFYKVVAFDGLTGWMRGRDITYGNRKPSEELDNDFTETKEIESSYIETFIKGRFLQAEIRKFPSQKNEVVGYLYKNEEAEFLLNQTVEKFHYKHQGTIYSDYWYQVRKSDGTEGWVFRGAVTLKERKVTVKELKKITYKLSNEVAKAYLNGEPLYYALAKDICERAFTEEQEKLREDVFNFKRLNPIDDYDRTVQAAYENALRRRAGLRTPDLAARQVINVQPPARLPKTAKAVSKETKIKPEQKSRHEIPAVASRQSLEGTSAKNEKQNKANLLEIDNLPKKAVELTTVSVSGKVKNATRRKIELSVYSDPILYKEDKREVQLGTDGSFNVDFRLSHGVFGLINYAGHRIEIWLEPGDNLQLDFDVADLQKSLAFSGQGMENNNYLKDKALQFGNRKEETRTKMQYASPQDFTAYVRAQEKDRKVYFAEYIKKTKLSATFLPIAEADINYWAPNVLLSYPYEHPLYHNQEAPMRVPTEYYEFLNDLEINVKGALPAENYIYFLQQYPDYLSLLPQNQGKTHESILRENLKDEAYYYSTAKRLTSACRRGHLAEAGQDIQKFINDSPFDVYSNVLRFAYNEAKGLSVGTKAPDFELTDINGETVRLSDFAGKVVYIDFWATWCAPCRRYLPHSQALADNFEEDEVIFLYISLDDKKSDWEDYVKTKGLHGVHVCAKNGHGYHTQIAELYKVKALPSYFLVDKEGKIAFSPASNPMSSKITDQIKGLLDK